MSPDPIPPRSGASAHLRPGQSLKITNPTGTQVVDTWAFAPLPKDSSNKAFDFKYLSVTHTRSSMQKLSLTSNDALRDNTRQPILTLVEDTSGGVHDLLFAACDKHRYLQLGVTGYHDSCVDNLSGQLQLASTQTTSLSLVATLSSASALVGEGWTPDPLNVFMNVPATALDVGKGESGELGLIAPICPERGYVMLRAEQECVVVMSACPMDLNAVNGGRNEGAEFEVFDD